MIAFKTRKSGKPKSMKPRALKRLKTLRAIYEKPQSLRTAFGLRRRKLSPSQKLLRLFSLR